MRSTPSRLLISSDSEPVGDLEYGKIVKERHIDRRAEPVDENLFFGFYCDVCYLYYRNEDFFALKCGHTYCINCTADNLKVNIAGGNAAKLPCMQSGCKETFGPTEIQAFCSKDIARLAANIIKDTSVGKNRRLKWCPQPGCETPVRKPCCRNRAICECGAAMCWKCGGPWHKGRCGVKGNCCFQMWAATNTNVVNCPGCGSRSVKEGGCNIMDCSRCGNSWCWVCHAVGIGYDHQDSMNLFGCPHQYSHCCLSDFLIMLGFVFLWRPIQCFFWLPYQVKKHRILHDYAWIDRINPINGLIQALALGLLTATIYLIVYPFILVPVLLYQIYKFLRIALRSWICCCIC